MNQKAYADAFKRHMDGLAEAGKKRKEIVMGPYAKSAGEEARSFEESVEQWYPGDKKRQDEMKREYRSEKP